MTIIENRDFIEGIFSTKEEAANYLKNHPDTSQCRIIECNTSIFPVYAAETERGTFRYFNDEKAFIDFLRNVDLTAISKKKGYVFEIDETGDCEEYETHDGLLTLYVFGEPFVSYAPNEDSLGSCDHYHISISDRERILKSNTISCLWEDSESEKRLLLECFAEGWFFGRFPQSTDLIRKFFAPL